MLLIWIKKIGLVILLLVLSATINEVYGKTFHASTQLTSSNSKENFGKGDSPIKKTFDSGKALKSNTSFIRTFKFLKSDVLLAKKELLVKKSKVKRKPHKLGKANLSYLLLNYPIEVLDERYYTIPYREITNLQGYQRIYDCWYAIEITPD